MGEWAVWQRFFHWSTFKLGTNSCMWKSTVHFWWQFFFQFTVILQLIVTWTNFFGPSAVPLYNRNYLNKKTFFFNIIVFRLCGIPVGVIVPEVRPIEKIVPPDPADPSSETKVQNIFLPDKCFCLLVHYKNWEA